MTHNDGFDRTVSDWLDEQAGHSVPGYLDEVLDADDPDPTAAVVVEPRKVAPRAIDSSLRTRCPGWPGSWSSSVSSSRLGTAILVAGSRETTARRRSVRRRSGTSSYAAADGDIYAIDTATNVARPLVTGPAADSDPLISPDGTSFAFVRRDAGSLSTSIMFLANADGSGLREITGLPEEVAGMALVTGRDQARGRRGSGLVDGRARHGADAGDADDQFRSRLRLLRISAVATERSRADLPLELIGHGPPDRGLRRPDGRIRPPRDRPTDDRGSGGSPPCHRTGPGSPIPCLGTDQREIHVVDVETGSDRRRRLRWSRRRCATAMVAGWDEARASNALWREGFQLMVGSVDGGPVTAIGPTRPDKSRWCRGPVLAGRNPKILAFYNADRTTWVLDPTGGPGHASSDYDAVDARRRWQRLGALIRSPIVSTRPARLDGGRPFARSDAGKVKPPGPDRAPYSVSAATLSRATA